jgi:hypothetical protein
VVSSIVNIFYDNAFSRSPIQKIRPDRLYKHDNQQAIASKKRSPIINLQTYAIAPDHLPVHLESLDSQGLVLQLLDAESKYFMSSNHDLFEVLELVDIIPIPINIPEITPMTICICFTFSIVLPPCVNTKNF